MLRLLHSITNAQETSLYESNCYRSAGEKPEESHNAHPNNQLCIEKWGRHCTLFVAICNAHYIALQTNHSVRNLSAMNPFSMKNVGKYIIKPEEAVM